MKKILLITAITFVTNIVQGQVTNGLVAKYSFNNGNANDEVGTNHLTQQNGATLGIDRFGNSNYAAFLDGTDDYLRTNNPFFYPGNNFTFSLWYKSSNAIQSKQTFFNTEPHQQISVGYNWFGDGSYDIALNDGVNWSICSNAANGLDTFFVNNVTATNWNHFTMTYDGSTWKSYINKNMVNLCNTGTPTSTISDLFFGSISVGPQSFFAGLLDDIRIYNRAISTIEIDSLFNEIDPTTVRISELTSTNNSFDVFPNPTNSILNINVSKPTTISIRNVLGQELLNRKIQTNETTDVSSFENGIYFVKDSNTGKSYKFVKQ